MNARLIDGEMVTVEDLMEKHSGMIWRFVGKYKRERLRTVMDWDDLKSIVHEALIIAFQQYDPERNIKFITLLDLWVKNRMQKEMVKLEKLYVPEMAHRYVETIRINGDMELTADQLIEKYECGRPTAEAIEQYFRFTFRSIHFSLFGEDGEMTIEEILGIDQDKTDVIVNEFLAMLNKEQLLILSWRMKDMTFTEIGKMLGVTRQAANLKIKKIRIAWDEFNAED